MKIHISDTFKTATRIIK